MWSPDRLSRRALLRGAALLGGGALVSACGFRPMHGEGSTADALNRQIRFSVPPGRLGHALRESLERRFGRAGVSAPWRLEATLDLEEEGLAITQDASITRYVLRGDSAWRVIGSDGTEALSGAAQSMSAYSADGSLYNSRAARRDAERRVAEDLGERIATQIAAALAVGRGPASGG